MAPCSIGLGEGQGARRRVPVRPLEKDVEQDVGVEQGAERFAAAKAGFKIRWHQAATRALPAPKVTSPRTPSTWSTRAPNILSTAGDRPARTGCFPANCASSELDSPGFSRNGHGSLRDTQRIVAQRLPARNGLSLTAAILILASEGRDMGLARVYERRMRAIADGRSPSEAPPGGQNENCCSWSVSDRRSPSRCGSVTKSAARTRTAYHGPRWCSTRYTQCRPS